MPVHTIHSIQRIPASIDEVWNFFSSAANLARITGKELGMKVISQYHGEKVYAGQIIEYTLRPVLGIPLYWMTEITHVQDKVFFADEQRKGPYNMWHHQHHFKVIEGGVEMKDIVHYKNPLGFMGRIANHLFVRRQLLGIFTYRFEKIEEIFGKWPGGQEMKISTG